MQLTPRLSASSFRRASFALLFLLTACSGDVTPALSTMGNGAPDGSQPSGDAGGRDDASSDGGAAADRAGGADADAGDANTADARPEVSPPALTLYASPTGSGTSCTLSDPCDLAGAQAQVRAANQDIDGDIAVNLRGGTYRLAAPFRMSPIDSGWNGHTVIYQAYADEQPVLSGSIRVSGFQSYDVGRNIWRAAVPPGTSSRQLYVNGVRAERTHTGRGATAFTPIARGLATVD